MKKIWSLKYIRKQENYTSNYKDYCIDYIEYKSIEDKIQNVELQLLNLLGDRTKKEEFHIGDLDMNTEN